MKLYYDQFSQHLTRQLLPAYLISGDEILFMQEAIAQLKVTAKQAGFVEWLTFSVDSSFDWSNFQAAMRSRSLFSEKQAIELRFSNFKISEAGKKQLIDYVTKPAADKLLLINAPKLDGNVQKSTWVKTIEKMGCWLTIWPLQPAQVLPWLTQRLRAAGFAAEREAVQMLGYRTQGNLLAASQEIEKLALTFAPGTLTVAQILEASSDQSRFELFDWVDAVLQQQAVAALRMLKQFKQEAVEPILIIWALARELRLLIRMAVALKNTGNIESVLTSNGVWEKRKPIVKKALQAYSLNNFQMALTALASIDQMIKGAKSGSVWIELEKLSLHLGGAR